MPSTDRDTARPTHRRRKPAMLGALAAGFGVASLAMAQQPVAEPALPPVVVKGAAEPQGKDGVQATETRIGKGRQELRDVPQSVTVVTERLIDDRNLDTLKDALKNTAGITFQAAEGGEEDIRLRGFSLQSTGDIFVDGIRDPAFYDRDSFNWDRLELLRGSASMLFGRGSTGGAANQVSKEPTTQLTRREISVTAGSGQSVRSTADMNLITGDSAALRMTAMAHFADGYGTKTDKQGLAAGYRWGIGQRDEFLVSLYHLDNDNGVHYGLPYLTNAAGERSLLPLDPRNSYAMASDTNAGGVDMGTLRHVRRFADGGELRSTLRLATYERDLRASAIRFGNASLQANGQSVTAQNFSSATVLTRGNQVKIQDMDTLYAQSDYSRAFQALGMRHQLLAGVDFAQEEFRNTTASALSKPTTTVGTPADGAMVDESLRVLSVNRTFDAKAVGVYVQDLVQVAPAWKLLAGLRWDRFEGQYKNITGGGNPNNPCTVAAGTELNRQDSLLSHRFGVLYQPTPLQSYHFSYGTSFNTAGDTYQFDGGSQTADPEKSRNIELGAKLDFAEGNFTTRVALFHATKYNERNRDAESANLCNYVLSGERHAAGFEIDLAGRITPAWEVFASYAFIPDAEVDAASAVTSVNQGQRPGEPVGLTPRHSATLWTTYKLTPKWRVGAGVNARSSVYPYLVTSFTVPSYVTGDLMVEYDAGPALVKVNLSNLTDKLYADQIYRGHYIPGKPRTLQVTTTMNF